MFTAQHNVYARNTQHQYRTVTLIVNRKTNAKRRVRRPTRSDTAWAPETYTLFSQSAELFAPD